MAEARLRERRATPVVRHPRPPPPVRLLRRIPYWRRARRIYIEHWVAGAIVALAFANAARHLAF
jgi:hypothetical protein